MKEKSIHMLRPVEAGPPIRETLCGRFSNGGGIGIGVLDFSCDDFLGTETPEAVTCKLCIERMRYDER